MALVFMSTLGKKILRMDTLSCTCVKTQRAFGELLG